jgi:hypothetical protein
MSKLGAKLKITCFMGLLSIGLAYGEEANPAVDVPVSNSPEVLIQDYFGDMINLAKAANLSIQPAQLLNVQLFQELDRSILSPAFTALIKGKSEEFLSYLSDEQVEKYNDQEVQKTLRNEYLAQGAFQTKAYTLSLAIQKSSAGVNEALFEVTYIAATKEGELRSYVSEVGIPVSSSVALSTESLDSMLDIIEGLVWRKTEIRSWKISSEVPTAIIESLKKAAEAEKSEIPEQKRVPTKNTSTGKVWSA